MANPPPNDLNVNLPEDEPVQPEHAPAMLGFAPAMLNIPNNNNEWIEWDVPLGGEMDEPIIDPGFDKEEMDDDDDDVGGPSTAMPVGHPLAIMAPGVATQPEVIDDLCIQMDNLEYRHGVLTRKMEAVSDAEVADSIAIEEIYPRVATMEGQNALAEYMILLGADNRPPMLDKDLLPPEWSKFVTDVKLVKDFHTSNYDQLHAYLEQHKLYANEVRLMRERNQDLLAFVANQQMTPPHYNTYLSFYNNP
nr:hypothetical protein [Tanacetum cinerariifolium]